MMEKKDEARSGTGSGRILFDILICLMEIVAGFF